MSCMDVDLIRIGYCITIIVLYSAQARYVRKAGSSMINNLD